QIARASTNLTPVRRPYLTELFPYDYGRGRRAVISDELSLLFVDDDDPDPKLTVGKLADRVRMETGQIPSRFRMFVVKPALKLGIIRVEERAPRAAREVFSDEYGYAEAVPRALEDFQSWLGKIDDVTYASVSKSQLFLGGRRSTCERA